jgi:hypothetical protein
VPVLTAAYVQDGVARFASFYSSPLLLRRVHLVGSDAGLDVQNTADDGPTKGHMGGLEVGQLCLQLMYGALPLNLLLVQTIDLGTQVMHFLLYVRDRAGEGGRSTVRLSARQRLVVGTARRHRRARSNAARAGDRVCAVRWIVRATLDPQTDRCRQDWRQGVVVRRLSVLRSVEAGLTDAQIEIAAPVGLVKELPQLRCVVGQCPTRRRFEAVIGCC